MLLLCWEQISLADAATVLQCSPVALKVRLHRARRRLAAALAYGQGSGMTGMPSLPTVRTAKEARR